MARRRRQRAGAADGLRLRPTSPEALGGGGHGRSGRTRPSDLYESDFYAWTQRQAALIRDGDVAAVDLPNILEEIETLGRKEVSELRSRYTVLATHLLKERYQPTRASRSWRSTILHQRIEIARHMKDNPSLKSKVDEIFAEAYADARLIAATETGLAVTTFLLAPPF